ncbi:MAG: sugar transferase, partial [Phycisphaerae bacterium]
LHLEADNPAAQHLRPEFLQAISEESSLESWCCGGHRPPSTVLLMPPSASYNYGKRLLDLVLASLALFVLAPLMIATALLIKLTSPGPVLFRQRRAGRHGRPFTALKFRTMRADRQPQPDELIGPDHPDVTPLGRLLRRTRIDELPQLLNVLAGQMSLVGPRPALPEHVRCYDNLQRRRLELRPGCTGLAQVNGNTAISWPERIKWDLYYVDHCSLWLDLTILLKTLAVIALGEQRFARSIHQTNLLQRPQP